MRRGASHASSTYTSNKRRYNHNVHSSKLNIPKIQGHSQISNVKENEIFTNNFHTVQKEFSVARNKLNQILKEYSFVRVLEIKYLAKTDSKHEFFFGKCETITNSLYGDKVIPKILFFDKAGRNKQETLNIGPCKLVDCAWGKDHASGRVDVGDILVGIQTTNPRSGTKIDRILTTWSKHGKILLDVSRIVEHGTKGSLKDIRNFVQQKESDLALQAQTFPSSFFYNSMGAYITQESLQRMASCKDDMYILLSCVLWGNLRPLAIMHCNQNGEGVRCKDSPTKEEEEFCKQLKISEKPVDFITLLSSKLEDPSLLSEFYSYFDEINYSGSTQNSLLQNINLNKNHAQREYGFDNNNNNQSFSFIEDLYGKSETQTPKYVPSSPIEQLKNEERNKIFCDLYSPESPLPNPSSPPYYPQSPKSPLKSPPKSPLKSPPKSPQSPLHSPPNSPKSPPESPTSAHKSLINEQSAQLVSLSLPNVPNLLHVQKVEILISEKKPTRKRKPKLEIPETKNSEKPIVILRKSKKQKANENI
jgi:hypothetical protein